MERIQLTFPEPAIFTWKTKVQVRDLNYGNHLGHDALVTLLQEARLAYLNHLGFRDELSLSPGIGLLLTGLKVSYQSECHVHDGLDIEVAPGETSRVGFELYYRVKKSDAIAAVALTQQVCYSYDQKKVASLPELFAAALRQTT